MFFSREKKFTVGPYKKFANISDCAYPGLLGSLYARSEQFALYHSVTKNHAFPTVSLADSACASSKQITFARLGDDKKINDITR